MSLYSFQNHHPCVAEDVFLAPGCAVIGRAEVQSGSSIWFQVTIRADVNDIHIGRKTNIQDNVVCHVTNKKHPLVIGNNVTVGHGAILHGCTLEDTCLVGMGAKVLDGAVVQTGAMVAAGALVGPGKVVRTGQLWAGVPATYKRDLTAEEVAYLSWSADHYATLAATYKKEMA